MLKSMCCIGESIKFGYHRGCRTCFGDIWIFAKFLIGLHRVLSIPLFSIWTAHISCIEKYDNFKSVEVQGWTPLKILLFLHWMLRPTFTTLLGKCRAISYWMGVPKKNAGNINRPPYHYTAVTHWACPPTSGYRAAVGYTRSHLFSELKIALTRWNKDWLVLF